MSVRAYGASLASYDNWATLTEYTSTNRVVPTVYNGQCYECTTAGTSGEIEPSWNSIPEQTTQDGTVLWTCRDYEGAPAALTVTVNPEGYGALPLKDIWVKSDGAVEFTVYGSYDGVNWRQIDEITVPHANRDNRHKRLENAYRFIRVSTETVATNEIEIVAGG